MGLRKHDGFCFPWLFPGLQQLWAGLMGASSAAESALSRKEGCGTEAPG